MEKQSQHETMCIHTGENTLAASQHCSSVCCCKELYARILSLVPSICFLLGSWKRLLGCPVRCPYNLPIQFYWFHCAQHTGRALICRVVDASLFRTTGRSSSGRDRGERQTVADSLGPPTARPGAAEADQTEVLTLRCSFTIKALFPFFSSCVTFLCQNPKENSTSLRTYFSMKKRFDMAC